MREAWEEGGVSGAAANGDLIGSYSYDKVMPAGLAVPVGTLVYSVAVEQTATRYPEADQRRRKWMTPHAAANLVNEAELKAILRNMA